MRKEGTLYLTVSLSQQKGAKLYIQVVGG